MKNAFRTIVLLSTFLVSLAAQAYEPLIREDRIWEYYGGYLSQWTYEGKSHITRYRFDGTQEADGKVYHQLKRIYALNVDVKLNFDEGRNPISSYTNEIVSYPDEVIALLREVDNKVYMYCGNQTLYAYNPESLHFEEQEAPDSKEIAILDFSDQIGSKFFAAGNYLDYFSNWAGYPSVTQYELISVTEENNWIGKRHTLKNIGVNQELARYGFEGNEDSNVEIIEGVGNIGRGTFFMPETEARNWPIGGSYSEEEEYFNNLYDLDGNILFKGSDIHPGTSGVSDIEISVEKEGKMYDLFGRELRPDAQLAPGTIYIRNGKKHVAK